MLLFILLWLSDPRPPPKNVKRCLKCVKCAARAFPPTLGGSSLYSSLLPHRVVPSCASAAPPREGVKMDSLRQNSAATAAYDSELFFDPAYRGTVGALNTHVRRRLGDNVSSLFSS